MLLQEQPWPVIDGLNRDTPVVIPIAAVEQHGHHLPLFTDSMLLGEIVRRIEEGMSDRVLIVPLQWLGNSHHHMDFPGTLSASPRTYLDLLDGLIENIVFHGFRRILLLNGHGGNDVPAKQVVFEVRQRHRQRTDLLLLAATYWALGEKTAASTVGMHQREMGHACEWETSMMLRIAPQLVGDYASLEAIEPGNPFLPATRGWVTKDRSALGHIGWPQLASEEKGEQLFATFTRDANAMLERMRNWDGTSWEG